MRTIAKGFVFGTGAGFGVVFVATSGVVVMGTLVDLAVHRRLRKASTSFAVGMRNLLGDVDEPSSTESSSVQ